MLISNEFNEMTEEAKNIMSIYREILLKNGYSEPINFDSSESIWRFYKPNTELTAFVINLNCTDNYIEVYYGCASTAFTLIKGCENVLVEDGIDNECINLRRKIILPIENDTATIDTIIKELYVTYNYIDKEKLLDLVKEKRKTFINKITLKLKPMGFKKKANSWKYTLENDYCLMFSAQKSAFSDEYYFNVNIFKENTAMYCDCFYRRISPDDKFPSDWQVMSDAQFDEFLNEKVEKLLTHIISTPLNELGKEYSTDGFSICDRKQCDYCWVNAT